MSNPIKITETISISKDEIFAKHSQMNQYFMDCIKALYGESVQGVDIKCFQPSNIIKDSGNNNYSILKGLEKRTGCYVFLNNLQIPVYIGIGGKKVNATQNLKDRLSQELRSYCKENATTSYSKDSGATLSKNIQEIDSKIESKNVTPDESIEMIKSFMIIVIVVGDINKDSDVLKSRALETILIALFHPKYNK